VPYKNPKMKITIERIAIIAMNTLVRIVFTVIFAVGLVTLANDIKEEELSKYANKA